MAPLSGLVGAVTSSIGLASSGHLVGGGQWLRLPMAVRGFGVGDTVGILVRWLPDRESPWGDATADEGEGAMYEDHGEGTHIASRHSGSTHSSHPGNNGGSAVPPPPLPANEACQLTFSVNGRVVGVSGPFVVPRGTDLFPTVSLQTQGVRAMGAFSAEDLRYCQRRVMVVADDPVEDEDEDDDDAASSSGSESESESSGSELPDGGSDSSSGSTSASSERGRDAGQGKRASAGVGSKARGERGGGGKS